MVSTNEIENAAVAQRWGFLNACAGRPWRGLDASEGLPRSALLGGDAMAATPASGELTFHTDRSCIPTCRARWW
jgi:hypothetical protein